MNGAINRILYVSLFFSVNLYPCDGLSSCKHFFRLNRQETTEAGAVVDKQYKKIENLKNLMLLGSLADFNERKQELNDLPSSDIQDLKRYHQDMQKGINAIEEVYANPHLKYCLEEMLQEIASKRLDVDLFIKQNKKKYAPDNDGKRALTLLHYSGTNVGLYISTTRIGIKELPDDKAIEHINKEKSRLASIAAILTERSSAEVDGF